MDNLKKEISKLKKDVDCVNKTIPDYFWINSGLSFSTIFKRIDKRFKKIEEELELMELILNPEGISR